MQSTRRCHVLYDSQCNLCAGGKYFFEAIGAADEFIFVDIHDAHAMRQFPKIDTLIAHGQMHLIDNEGKVFGGYDAVVEGLRRMPRFALLHGLLSSQYMIRIGPIAYAWLARNRYRLFGRTDCGGTCAPRTHG